MLRYKLRTLLIVLALGPPMIAAGWWGWGEYSEYREWRERERMRAIFAPMGVGIREVERK